MEPLRFIRTLQTVDSFFPVGAFAYSDGLETAAAKNHVRDAASLGEWMDHFLNRVFIPCEGLALVKCMYALKHGDIETVCRIDEELTAIRPAAAVRAGSTGVGKRVLGLYSALYTPTGILKDIVLPETNAAAAYAVVFFQSGLDERDGALAFGYNRLTGIVSAGLRLITIGHHQGQALLTKYMNLLPDAVGQILQRKDEPLCSFNPLLDIEQMNHQYVYSRLFRS
jgi:urease accessory protein